MLFHVPLSVTEREAERRASSRNLVRPTLQDNPLPETRRRLTPPDRLAPNSAKSSVLHMPGSVAADQPSRRQRLAFMTSTARRTGDKQMDTPAAPKSQPQGAASPQQRGYNPLYLDRQEDV